MELSTAGEETTMVKRMFLKALTMLFPQEVHIPAHSRPIVPSFAGVTTSMDSPMPRNRSSWQLQREVHIPADWSLMAQCFVGAETNSSRQIRFLASSPQFQQATITLALCKQIRLSIAGVTTAMGSQLLLRARSTRYRLGDRTHVGYMQKDQFPVGDIWCPKQQPG